MDKTIKILCICNQGNCRSVATRYCLNRRGYTDVIAIGGANTSAQTLADLYIWADLVLLAKPTHSRFLPIDMDKVDIEFTIGEDKWGNPMNKELHEIINKQLDLIKLI